MYGKWPIPAYTKLSPDAQKFFWQHKDSGKLGMDARLEKLVIDNRINETSKHTKGDYWPIAVYHRQGYSGEMLDNISKNCDREWNDDLKIWTFCLDVKGRSSAEITKEVQQELANLRRSNLGRAFSCYASPHKRKRDSSSSSNGSNSSDKSKSSKKSKVEHKEKTAKEQRAEAIAAKKAEKEEAKATAKAKKDQDKAAQSRMKQQAQAAKKHHAQLAKEQASATREEHTHI